MDDKFLLYVLVLLSAVGFLFSMNLTRMLYSVYKDSGYIPYKDMCEEEQETFKKCVVGITKMYMVSIGIFLLAIFLSYLG